MLDLFDRVHQRHAFDTQNPSAHQFLVQVLAARAGPNLLTGEAMSSLASLSGGFLRDLLALARDAGEAAYVRGGDGVTEADVRSAAEKFGQSLAFGTSDEELVVLRAVANTGRLVVRGPLEATLVDRRALIAYPAANQGAGERWAVHPCLLEVLVPAGLMGGQAS